MRTTSKNRWLASAMSALLIAALACVGLTGCSAGDAGTSAASEPASEPAAAEPQEPQTRTITDMAGRTVELPVNIESVATFGSVGVLNAFVECMGKGDLIASDMPANFTKNDKWAMQYQFAPQMKGKPVLETADGIDMEATMALAPDVCITMMEDMAQQLEEAGISAIVLTWNDTEDVKKAVDLMGEVFGVQDRADEYNAYFDEMVKKAADRTAGLSDADRLKVIYGDVESLTNPHIISEWWLTAAGGDSVTEETHQKNSLEYTMEELLAWQPQVIFSSNTDVDAIYADANIADLPAVKDQRVYVVPTVAHVWGNRTVEQPLTVLWAMNKMYPELIRKRAGRGHHLLLRAFLQLQDERCRSGRHHQLSVTPSLVSRLPTARPAGGGLHAGNRAGGGGSSRRVRDEWTDIHVQTGALRKRRHREVDDRLQPGGGACAGGPRRHAGGLRPQSRFDAAAHGGPHAAHGARPHARRRGCWA